MNNREECLRKACECVNGAREQNYGSPEDSFETIADFWTAYLGTIITRTDVAMMMALLKIARIKNGQGAELDSFVDLAGYASCGFDIAKVIFKQAEDDMPKSGRFAWTPEGEKNRTDETTVCPYIPREDLVTNE